MRCVQIPYALLCTLLGLAICWVPALIHGPIAYKFNVLGIDGPLAVWAFYGVRMLIGFMVGITSWPARWYVRGPLCGFLMMFPLGVLMLATPGCGRL